MPQTIPTTDANLDDIVFDEAQWRLSLDTVAPAENLISQPGATRVGIEVLLQMGINPELIALDSISGVALQPKLPSQFPHIGLDQIAALGKDGIKERYNRADSIDPKVPTEGQVILLRFLRLGQRNELNIAIPVPYLEITNNGPWKIGSPFRAKHFGFSSRRTQELGGAKIGIQTRGLVEQLDPTNRTQLGSRITGLAVKSDYHRDDRAPGFRPSVEFESHFGYNPLPPISFLGNKPPYPNNAYELMRHNVLLGWDPILEATNLFPNSVVDPFANGFPVVGGLLKLKTGCYGHPIPEPIHIIIVPHQCGRVSTISQGAPDFFSLEFVTQSEAQQAITDLVLRVLGGEWPKE